MGYTLGELALRLEAKLTGDAALHISGMAEIEKAKPDQLCFAESEDYLDALQTSKVGAAIVAEAFPEIEGLNLLRVADPRISFIRAMELFSPDRRIKNIHPSAIIAPSAQLAEDVGVGPNVVVEQGARIGAGTTLRAGAYIGENASIGQHADIGPNVSILADCVIGDHCVLHPGVCIGSDGYGYQWLGDHHHKIPQLGNVVIGNNVEIGSNCSIDRATLGSTTIGDGTKLDNLVHIAHNNQIGKHALITAQVGFAGSCVIGDSVVFGGQAGVADHITIGEGVLVAGQAGVVKDIPAGEKVWGNPARPMIKAMKEQAAISKLAKKQGELRALRNDIEALKTRLEGENSEN